MDHFLEEFKFNMMHLIIVCSVLFGILGILEAYSFRFSTIHTLKLTFLLSTVGAFIWLALVIYSLCAPPWFTSRHPHPLPDVIYGNELPGKPVRTARISWNTHKHKDLDYRILCVFSKNNLRAPQILTTLE
jgi:ABC-type iron transport system FetAB permease component